MRSRRSPLTGRRRGLAGISGAMVLALVLGAVISGVRSGTSEAAPGASAASASPAPVAGSASTTDRPRVPWEGGPSYYEAFPAMRDAGWTDPRFFPIGAWFQAAIAPEDVKSDKSIGINTYVEMTENSDMSLVRASGMFAFAGGPRVNQGGETVGWVLEDEADMYAGPGAGEWTGNFAGEGQICQPESARCGYSIMRARKAQHPADGRALYANYGKGVFLWETDEEAAPFINEFPEVVSTDIYWYTDPRICDEAANSLGTPQNQCRLAANYGAVIDRERYLDGMDGRRQPIYGVVEVGKPFSDGGSITPEQIAGAVMNSIIHEARGIIYFTHTYADTCGTTVLRDSCGADLRPAVARVNERVRELAPVLNTQSFESVPNPEVDTMLKEFNGSYYLFSMLGRGLAPGTHTVTLPSWLAGASSAEVMFEDRTVELSVDGELVDTFDAETAYHIYKIIPAR